MCTKAKATGNLAQDAWFAALAIESGCEWITTDRDYARFGEFGLSRTIKRESDAQDCPTLASRLTRSSSSCANVSVIPPSIPAMAPSRASFEG
jgi:hypothetical protein